MRITINLETELAGGTETATGCLTDVGGSTPQNLQKRAAASLCQHQAGVLWRRQGGDPGDREEEDSKDFKPIIVQIEAQQQQTEELQKLEQGIRRWAIAFSKRRRCSTIRLMNRKCSGFTAREQTLLSLRATAAEGTG